jgi:hypothetical protein
MKTSSLLLLALAACGSEPELSLGLRLSAALHDRAQDLGLWVYGPERSDGIQLGCQSLLSDDVTATDSRLTVLANTQIPDFTSGGEIVVSGVASGRGRIVFVEVYDAAGARVGVGCEQAITVPEGGSVSVEVTVYELR